MSFYVRIKRLRDYFFHYRLSCDKLSYYTRFFCTNIPVFGSFAISYDSVFDLSNMIELIIACSLDLIP